MRAAARTVAWLLITSLLASGLVVTAVRVVQRRWFPTVRRVPVTVSLGTLRPVDLAFAGHVGPAGGARSVTARIGATGLLSVAGAGGAPLGLAIVAAPPELPTPPVTVDFASTAAALVVLSALPTSSPTLSTVVSMVAQATPQVGTLAALLASEAGRRPDFLLHLDAAEHVALRAADQAVEQQLVDVFSGAASPGPQLQSLVTGPGDLSPTRSVRPAVPRARRGAVDVAGQLSGAPAGTPLVAESVLTGDVPVPDDTGRTACQSHAVADGLCVAVPLPALDSLVSLTDWTASWQLVYRAQDLSVPGGVAAPVALLPPAANLPPTISGTVSSVVQTATRRSIGASVCREGSTLPLSDRKALLLANGCTGSTADAIGSALLSELTLTAQGSTVQAYVAPWLDGAPLTVIGAGDPTPTSGAGLTAVQESLASRVCLDLTMVTAVAIPLISMVLDKVIHPADDRATTAGEDAPGEAPVLARAEGAAAGAEASSTGTAMRLLRRAGDVAAKAWASHAARFPRTALSAVVDTFLAPTAGAVLDPAAPGGAPVTAAGSAPALQAAAVFFSQSAYLVPILFPALTDASAAAGLFAGAATAAVGGPLGVFDHVMALVGDVQDAWDLVLTLAASPWQHRYPPLATVHGGIGTESVAPLVQVVSGPLPSSPAAPANGTPGGAFSAIGNLVADDAGFWAHPSITATAVVSADPGGSDTVVIDPAAEIHDRWVLLADLAQLGELHLGGSGAKAVGEPVSLGDVPFSVLLARLPVGQGPVAFSPAPAVGQRVDLAEVGVGMSILTSPATAGRVTSVLELPGPDGRAAVAFTVRAGGGLATGRGDVGGFVYGASGAAAGHLVGLAEVETSGQITALTGVGVRYLVCQQDPAGCAGTAG